MAIMRRIYATVDENTFAGFRSRAHDEGLSLAEALEAICIAYSKGLTLVRRKQDLHHEPETAILTGAPNG